MVSESSNHTPAGEADPNAQDRLLICGVILLLIGLFGLGLIRIKLALALIALLFALGGLLIPRHLVLFYFAALLGLCSPLSERPLSLAGIRVYGADAMIYFLGLAGLFVFLKGLPRAIIHNRGERTILILQIILTAFGLIALANGIVLKGFGLNDALGDYRRMFFYPLAILIPTLLGFTQGAMGRLRHALLGGMALVILTGLYRLLTGQTWAEDYFLAANSTPRLLSYTETLTLTLSVAWLAATFRTAKSMPMRIAALGLAAVAASFLLISGWRVAILYGLFAPALALLLVGWLKREPIGGLLRGAVVLILLIIVSFVGAVQFMPEYGAELVDKMRTRFTEFDASEDQRIYSTITALEYFAEDPVLGAGMGHQFFMFKRGSDGTFMGVEATTHNMYIDYFYKSGVVGFFLLLSVHGAFLIYCFRRCRKLRPKFHALATGLFVGYLCVMTSAMLEPFQTAGIVSLYFTMGFLLVLLRFTVPEKTTDQPPEPVGTV